VLVNIAMNILLTRVYPKLITSDSQQYVNELIIYTWNQCIPLLE